MTHEVMSPAILHPEYFKAPFGGKLLTEFVDQLAGNIPIEPEEAPNLVIAIQSYAHSPEDIRSLEWDIRSQEYPPDKIHTILLNTANPSETTETARALGIEVIDVPARNSLRADQLNAAANEASKLGADAFVSTVGHAALSNVYFLSSAAGYASNMSEKARAGCETVAYGVALPKGGTLVERTGARFLGAAKQLLQDIRQVTQDEMGIMSSDCAVWPVHLVHRLEGFDRRFGLGGADGEMARRMLRLGVTVTQDALLSAHVTKGFGLRDSMRQLQIWRSLNRPQDFDPKKFEGWHPYGGL